MSEEKKYPIAEIFTSPQGEGLHVGVLMTFVRTAGCSVGKPFPKEQYAPSLGLNQVKMPGTAGLPIYTEQCTTYDGRTFECDTDYRVKERLTVDEIIARIPQGVQHVCISGGEPFIHDLVPLAGDILNKGIQVHIETSGTVPLAKPFGESDGVRNWVEDECWITVSPKLGVLDEMLKRADEIKLLVDENFDVNKIPLLCLKPESIGVIYIQPINGENIINFDNLRRCLALQRVYPHWRISNQSHKIWNVR